MNVIGIKFKDGGKVYYFAPGEGAEYAENMEVIVETGKGAEFAYVAFLPREVEESEVTQPLRPVLRIATDKDREVRKKNLERRPEAIRTAQEKANKYELPMKIIDCEFAFDGSKVLFFFSAENRVDFRELVRDLAGTFRSRIELRQVGARDEVRLLGGIGPCGRECCCVGAMQDFCKVSIKMAKVQGLSLNPGKISGLCGRLMCCLSYENEFYSEAYKKMPKLGGEVHTPEGKGTVVSTNMLTSAVRVKIEKDGALIYRDFAAEDVSRAEPDRADARPAPRAEDAEDAQAEGAQADKPLPGAKAERRDRRQERPEHRAAPAQKNGGGKGESPEGRKDHRPNNNFRSRRNRKPQGENKTPPEKN